MLGLTFGVGCWVFAVNFGWPSIVGDDAVGGYLCCCWSLVVVLLVVVCVVIGRWGSGCWWLVVGVLMYDVVIGWLL